MLLVTVPFLLCGDFGLLLRFYGICLAVNCHSVGLFGVDAPLYEAWFGAGGSVLVRNAYVNGHCEGTQHAPELAIHKPRAKFPRMEKNSIEVKNSR